MPAVCGIDKVRYGHMQPTAKKIGSGFNRKSCVTEPSV